MNTTLWDALQVSGDGIEKLKLFEDLARKWTQKINLISRNTIDDIWGRHIEDSAQIMLSAPQNPKIWADFGSGGGFPGIIVATILADRKADTKVILVESDQRKSAFLREAKRNLGLDLCEVVAQRAEMIEPIGADVISARALASLDMLCGFAQRHGRADGLCLFPKGETWEDEVAIAQKNWEFDLVAIPDTGHSGSALLKLRNLRRANSAVAE